MSVAATIVVVLVVALWGLAIYKRLVRYRAAVRTGWSRLEAARSRRRELIAAIVSASTDGGTPDREAIEALASAAQHAAASRGPADAAAREEALTVALNQLCAAVDREPPNPPIQDLRRALAAAETALADARASYNDAAAAYNRSIEAAPDNLVAGLASFSKAERFETRRV